MGSQPCLSRSDTAHRLGCLTLSSTVSRRCSPWPWRLISPSRSPKGSRPTLLTQVLLLLLPAQLPQLLRRPQHLPRRNQKRKKVMTIWDSLSSIRDHQSRDPNNEF